MSFAGDTAVTDTGGGSYRAHIQDGWDIGGNANGGYLIAIAARAMREASGRPDPVTVTAHYLRPGRPGAVSVDTQVVKAGKRFTTVQATLVDAEGRPLLALLGTFGDAGAAVPGQPALLDGGPPDLPAFAAGIAREKRSGPGGEAPGFSRMVDVRLHPDDAGFDRGDRSGRAEVRGWFALRDGEEVDTVGLLLAADAFPPTVFNLDLPIAWVPTVELTVHVRARPAPGPLRCRFTTRFVSDGFLEEDSEVWDGAGTLVAQSRQLALLPRV